MGTKYLHFVPQKCRKYVPSKALVPTHQTKECHNPEDHTMSLHHCETMKSYMTNTVLFLQSLPYL